MFRVALRAAEAAPAAAFLFALHSFRYTLADMNPRLFALLILSFLLGSAAIVTAQDPTPEQKFAASLNDYTASKPVIVNEVPEDEEELAGVKSVKVLRFKSNKPVSANPDTYATLALIVLEYEDANSAFSALGNVPSVAEEELRKSPELDFVSGSRIYRLVGACALSEENWKGVEQKLIDAVLGPGKAPERWVRIACGGNVSVSNE